MPLFRGPLQLQRQELLGLVVERRAEAAQRALELVHGPELLPHDVHGHGQLRDGERAAVRRGTHEPGTEAIQCCRELHGIDMRSHNSCGRKVSYSKWIQYTGDRLVNVHLVYFIG